MTALCGVMGYPIRHSVSPAFQQAAFNYCGLDVRYDAWEVPPADLDARVARLRQTMYLGSNVTIPHKGRMLALVDRCDAVATAAGAVNTVVSDDGRLSGYNTDVAGFLQAVTEDGAFDPARARAVVLGAGGAARAVVLALLASGAHHITVANRTVARAAELRHVFDQLSVAHIDAVRQDVRPYVTQLSFSEPCTCIEVVGWHGAELQRTIAASDLIVNCTSLGMHGHQVSESPLPAHWRMQGNALVVDIVANPRETVLMRWARDAGARAIGGLPMLINQGAVSFSIWTGIDAPRSVMRAAAMEAMQRA